MAVRLRVHTPARSSAVENGKKKKRYKRERVQFMGNAARASGSIKWSGDQVIEVSRKAVHKLRKRENYVCRPTAWASIENRFRKARLAKIKKGAFDAVTHRRSSGHQILRQASKTWTLGRKCRHPDRCRLSSVVPHSRRSLWSISLAPPGSGSRWSRSTVEREVEREGG